MITKNKKEVVIAGLFFVALALFGSVFVFAATPAGPDSFVYGDNYTKTNPNAQMVNTSGGVISTFNLTSNVQNPRWKAFVGNVDGSFSLQNSDGSATIYDWTLSSLSGNVYATRQSAAITWSGIDCATLTEIESENTALSHTGASDNITTTFRSATHSQFVTSGVTINANNCYSLNTYNDTGSQDNDFEEMVLIDSGKTNIIYASIIEDDATGFNGQLFDFQMIVPENGSASWSGTIPYYVYVELQ